MNSVLQRLLPLRQVGILSKTFTIPQIRALGTTNPCLLKEITITKKDEGKLLVVEGQYVKSPRENHLLNINQPKFSPDICDNKVAVKGTQPCPLCKLGLEVKHTDVLILQQFLNTYGKLMQRRITGLCKTQQRRVDYLIKMAEMAGILKTPMTREPRLNKGFMKYNKYYDESVIDEFIFGGRRGRAYKRIRGRLC